MIYAIQKKLIWSNFKGTFPDIYVSREYKHPLNAYDKRRTTSIIGTLAEENETLQKSV